MGVRFVVRSYNRLMVLVLSGFAAAVLLFNVMYFGRGGEGDLFHNVEINRLMERISGGEPVDSISLAGFERVVALEFLPAEAIVGDDGDRPADAQQSEAERFFEGDRYAIRPLFSSGSLMGYVKFSYVDADSIGQRIIWLNAILLSLFIGMMVLLLYIKAQIIRPMNVFTQLPSALAKGDFTTPVRAQKARFFGRFLWGLDMLRQTMSHERQRTLALEKEKSETALSLSHDIKTPLGAIILCSKALQEGLYNDQAKQQELLGRIGDRAHEIEGLVAAIQRSVSEEMLDMPVNAGEFYLSGVVTRVESAYGWQMELAGTSFLVGEYSDCLLRGDADRVYEAICNMIENAMKYGDGKLVSIHFPVEENCQLITVTNTGNTLPSAETVRLFDSFWRGSNAAGKQGNGLGLFIVRQLAVKMGGDAYAANRGDEMDVTLVLRKA